MDFDDRKSTCSVSSSLGNNCQRSPYQRLVVDTFGGSLCTSSGHSSSTSSRISSGTSERPSVSRRNLCSRSKSSCTMIWSEIIRGAKIRFDFTFSVLPLFVLFNLAHEPPQLIRFRPSPCARSSFAVYSRLMRKRVKCRSVPASCCGASRQYRTTGKQRGRSGERCPAFMGKCAASS
jgi:hypothetical protein